MEAGTPPRSRPWGCGRGGDSFRPRDAGGSLGFLAACVAVGADHVSSPFHCYGVIHRDCVQRGARRMWIPPTAHAQALAYCPRGNPGGR